MAIENLEPKTRLEYFLNQIAESGGSGGGDAPTEPFVVRATYNAQNHTWTLDQKAVDIFDHGGGGLIPVYYDCGNNHCVSYIESFRTYSSGGGIYHYSFRIQQYEDQYASNKTILDYDAVGEDSYPVYTTIDE